LQQAAASVDRLRNFRLRLVAGQFHPGATEAMVQLANQTTEGLRAGMEEDLNTAQAQAAVFDMVRAANAAIDSGEIRQDDAQMLLTVLDKFDELFAVLKDDDAVKVKRIVDWARTHRRQNDISPEALEIARSAELSDEVVEQKVNEMQAARRARDFKTSDSLRAELIAAGILVENTKDGARWRRK
jgi:cysteinyl-tRNA synthetase